MKDTLSSVHELADFLLEGFVVKPWFNTTYTLVYLYFEIDRDPFLKVPVLG